jgi:hypothetical protein
MPKAKLEKDKWEVYVSKHSDFVVVEPCKDGIRLPNIAHGHGSYVHIPNFIERLLGITLEKKINRAVVGCQKWCDKQNAKETMIEKGSLPWCIAPPEPWHEPTPTRDKVFLLTTGDGSDGSEWDVQSIHNTMGSAEIAKAKYEAPRSRDDGSTYTFEANIEEWCVED